jgi:hypothetical protein
MSLHPIADKAEVSVADRVNQLSDGWSAVPIDQRTAFRVEA